MSTLTGAALAVPLGCGSGNAAEAPQGPPQKTRRPKRATVGQAASARAAARGDDKQVAELVAKALCAAFDATDPREVMRHLVAPTARVAIKPNCLAGPALSSSPAVVGALVALLRTIGVPARNILIFERTTAELERAGYTVRTAPDSDAPLCMGNDALGFSKRLVFSGQVGSLFSRAVTDFADVLINVPVVKDHDLSGVGCGLKNLFGLIHNPNRYHDNHCDPFVVDVAQAPVRASLVLTVADALVCQYHGGPAAAPRFQWRPGAVWVSGDPVAIDAVALRAIEMQRAKAGLPSLKEAKRFPSWLTTAERRGLGTASPSRIHIAMA